MKIGFLLTDQHAGKGGLETVLATITQGLKKSGVESYIFMLRPPEQSVFLKEFDNIEVMPNFFNSNKQQIFPRFIAHQLWKHVFVHHSQKFLHKSLNAQKLDSLIILNLSKDFLRIIPAIKKYKKQHPRVTIIAWPHGSLSILKKDVQEKLKREIAIFDRVLAISQGLKNELSHYISVDKIDLIYNPVQEDTLIPQDPRKFIYIGRIADPGKRLKQLLTTMSKLKGDWSLDIIGSSGTPTRDQIIIDHAIMLGIENRVIFHGWQIAPWSCIKSTGTLLLNSESEGFGLVLAEAMMRGIPCVSSNCPVGPSEIIEEGINGWLFEPDDQVECYNILQSILDGSRQLPNPKDIVASVAKFSTQNVINNFIIAIKNSISEKSSSEKDR